MINKIFFSIEKYRGGMNVKFNRKSNIISDLNLHFSQFLRVI